MGLDTDLIDFSRRIALAQSTSIPTEEDRSADSVNPLDIISEAPRFLRAQAAEYSAPESDEHRAKVEFCSRRGGLPVIPATLGPSCVGDTVGPVFVAANGGAQLHNSPVFYRPEEICQSLVRANEYSTAGTMLAYSRAGDVFVFQRRNEELERTILADIADSYAAIGLNLSRDFRGVDSVSDWIQANLGNVAILPNILSYPMLRQLEELCPDSSTPMRRAAVANVAAYTKHGAQKLWAENGLPTPPSYYEVVSQASRWAVVSEIKARFSNFDAVVINRIDGSGGFGIRKVRLEHLREEHLDFGEENCLLQVQGFVPARSSPCLIANINSTAHGVCAISEQRFSEFGVHCGNHWDRQSEEEALCDEEFYSVAVSALESLRRAGVVGQVNLDFLCLAPEVQREYGLESATLLREANIRPAGSSILLSIRQGTVDGQSIARISTSFKILDDFDAYRRFKSELAIAAVPGVCRAVLCNAAKSDDGRVRVTLAFVGSEHASAETLANFERAVLAQV